MEKARRHDVLMTGVGGKGVLVAGLLLAEAAMDSYKSVLWFPSYQAAMRGGPCECTVVLSDEEIASPVLTQAQSLVVMEPSQLKPFEGRVLPGGLLLAEAAGFKKEQLSRQDVRLVLVPGVEMALALGDPQAANLVLLGAYLHLTGALPLEVLEARMGQKFAGREKALQRNKAALERGVEYARHHS